MPPKKAFSREVIVEAGFQVIRKYGINNLSARLIAKELDASTMPIYSIVSSIEELRPEITAKVTNLFIDYALASYTGKFSIDTGFGYIRFAREEKALFRSMVFTEDATDIATYKEQKQRVTSLLFERFKQEPEFAGFSEHRLARLMEKMYIVTHGIACLVNYGRLEDDRDETIIALLHDLNRLMVQHELALEE